MRKIIIAIFLVLFLSYGICVSDKESIYTANSHGHRLKRCCGRRFFGYGFGRYGGFYRPFGYGFGRYGGFYRPFGYGFRRFGGYWG
ncbi:hypothetical protein AB6A40_008023 [Gnathostoma spinigerum]|uniref:Uncharacterized protein n=1 Tax=Gnathostoma spinigerum TaxID=75299 RepID=A0ABD6EMW2_9BILA